MPKQEQTIILNNTNKETAFAIAYQAMKNSGWMIKFAGPDKLLANTPKNWKNNPLQVIITIVNDNLMVSSETISGESFDVLGKNKKAVAAFISAFEDAGKSTNETTIENNKNAINALREETIKAAEQEEQQAAEIDKAMNLSGSNLYVTYTIIGINILVFILMVADGAGIMGTNQYVHIRWGSNYSPLTLSGDWWRLITNVFIHFGIIHVLMNMFCLYMAGVYLEPMLGKLKYTAAYLCTGVLASLVSLWWHKDGINSAGASGAIFGMYGLFLALLTTNLIPKAVRQALLQSIGIFVVYNLVYGMKSGVDNAAHVGGLLSGFIIGYMYVFGIKKEKQEQKVQWLVPVIILLTVGGAYGYLNQNKVSAEQRVAELGAVEGAAYKDNDKFKATLQEIIEIENKAVAPLEDSTLTNSELKKQIDSISYPLWIDASAKLKATTGFEISPKMHEKADKLIKYVELRKEELDVYLKFINAENTEGFVQALNEVRKKINDLGATAE